MPKEDDIEFFLNLMEKAKRNNYNGCRRKVLKFYSGQKDFICFLKKGHLSVAKSHTDSLSNKLDGGSVGSSKCLTDGEGYQLHSLYLLFIEMGKQ